MSHNDDNSLAGWSRIILGACTEELSDGCRCTLTRGHVVDHEFETKRARDVRRYLESEEGAADGQRG